MPDIAIVNGRMQDLHEAAIPATDLAFLRGCGAFETWRTYGGHPHELGRHLIRMWDAAALFGVAPFVDEPTLRRWLQKGHRASGYAELKVNAVCSPGDHVEDVFGASEPRLVLLLRELHEPPAIWYEDGVSVITHQAQRTFPQHKTVNYLCGVPALDAAKRQGAHEALYCDADGFVSEGITSNVHALIEGKVRSSLVNCLPGITRLGLQELVTQHGLSWEDSAVLHKDELYTADEVWISSSIREVVPVVQVDEHRIGDGKPGKFARLLKADYRAQCESDSLRDASVHG